MKREKGGGRDGGRGGGEEEEEKREELMFINLLWVNNNSYNYNYVFNFYNCIIIQIKHL